MRCNKVVVALTVLILATATAGVADPLEAAQPVFLKAQVVVEDQVVRLDDLFAGLDEAGATPVARAPEPGRRVRVGARWLAAVAQTYGIPWRPRSRFEKVVIERASQTIDTPRIEAEVLDALRRKGTTGALSLVLDNPALRLTLPTRVAQSVAVTGLTHDPRSGRFTAHLVAPADGAPLVKITVSGRAVALIEVPVLRRRVAPGEVIHRDDLDWISLRADRLGRNVVLEPETLIGKSPRRPIRAGALVRTGELRRPVLVPKNSLVTVRLEVGPMALTTRGRALEPGAAGDVIRVMNTQSHKVIRAEVAESGLVRIHAANPSAAN